MRNHVEWEEKCWGRVAHIFISGTSAVSVLEVKKGWCCSWHHHDCRDNQFTVLSGKIRVLWGFETEGCGCSVELNPGESFTVYACQLHRFEVLEDGMVVEVYSPSSPGWPVDIRDIVRRDQGGRTDGI